MLGGLGAASIVGSYKEKTVPTSISANSDGSYTFNNGQGWVVSGSFDGNVVSAFGVQGRLDVNGGIVWSNGVYWASGTPTVNNVTPTNNVSAVGVADTNSGTFMGTVSNILSNGVAIGTVQISPTLLIGGVGLGLLLMMKGRR